MTRTRLIVLLLLLAARASAAPMVLHHGTAADPPSLDPSVAAGTLASPVLTDLVYGLLVRDAGSRPVAGSAESWTVSDDGLTYTFRLRAGLRWSDGKPITSEDFVWSFRRLMTPATGSQLSGAFFLLDKGREVFRGEAPPESLGVTAPDERTVVIRLANPAPYFLELLANIQAAPVPRHVIEQYGRDWTKPGRMVGNGPYVLAERVPQSYIKLVKNPNFFDAAKVAIDEIWWHPTQDLATSLRRFRAGELDVVLNFPPDEIGWIRKNIPETLHITPSLASYFITVNTKRKPFDDVRVRRALYLALDREAITGKLLRTGVKPAWSWASPDFEGYGGITVPEASVPLARRQAEARELLAKAGFTASNPLTVPFLYDTQEENRKIAVAVAAMWQAVGVKTTLSNIEFSLLFNKVRSKDYDVARWTYFSTYDDAYAFLQVLATGHPNNWPGWSNARYDELVGRSNSIRDPAERATVLREAETIMLREAPVIPVYWYVGRRLVATKVKGWVDTPRGTTPTRYLSVE